MADWPMISTGVTPGAESAVLAVSASASTNTKGAWTEAFSSVPYLTSGIFIDVYNANAINISFLFDVGIGASGSEIVIIENLAWGCANTYGKCASVYFIPICLNQGERVSFRCQGSVASKNLIINTALVPKAGNDIFLSCVDTIGANTASSIGTNIDPGGTAETFGPYVEISASAVNTYKGFFLSFPWGGAGLVDANYTITFAKGGSGAEIDFFSCNLLADGTRQRQYPETVPFIPMPIPAGTRISAKGKSTSSNATYRLINVIFHGVY